MADLLIPATLRYWLYFLLAFVVLRYPPSFSILFGAIGGIAGGLLTAWWQIKAGAPSDSAEEVAIEAPPQSRKERGSGWRLPFFTRNQPRRRYLERTRRARASRRAR